MKNSLSTASRVVLIASMTVAPVALGQSVATDTGTLDKETAKAFPKPPYSPYAGRNFPMRPFFGDTHLHTSFSMDAGAFGAAWGRRKPIVSQRGGGHGLERAAVKLSRPLDFLVVADHSDNMGFFPDFLAGKPEMLADPTGRRWYDMIQSGKGAEAAIEIIVSFLAGQIPEGADFLPGTPAYRSAWRETIKAAEEANDPGRFTAFIGYEWTSNTRRQQPAPQRDLPRRRRRRPARSSRTPRMPPLGSDNPARPVEVDGGVRGEDRRRRARHRAQRQPEQRHDVPDHRVVHRQADRPRVRRDAGEVGARSTRPPRSRATARRIRSFRPTTSSPTSSAGTRATST